jgi:hypothetical protein
MQRETDVTRHSFRAGLGCVAVAAAFVLPILVAAGPASASTGNWGWGGPGQSIAPGAQNLTTGFSCRGEAPCGYNPGMTVMVTAFNGATLSAPTSLTSTIDGSVQGTCTLQDPTHIVCAYTSSGFSDLYQGALFSYTLTVPGTATAGSTVATQTWADSPQTGNVVDDDVYTFYTTGPVAPTTKDQCRLGTWQDYGTMFKNQGDCVRSVTHLG